jgi:hypothetical protein
MNHTRVRFLSAAQQHYSAEVMKRFAYAILTVTLLALVGCAKKEASVYVVNVIGRNTSEMISAFGNPNERHSRTGEIESLVWKEGGFSVQSTTKEGKVMRLAFLSKDSTLLESILSKVKDRFSEGRSWRSEKKKVFDDIVEVAVRADSKITVYRDKEAVYVFGLEIW